MKHNSGSLCTTKITNLGVNRGKKVILQDISLEIHCGEMTALIGPNGAGKSTFLKAILGEIPYRGGLDFYDAAGRRAKKPVIGYVPQRLDFDPGSPLSVLDLFSAAAAMIPVCFFNSRRQIQRAEEDLARFQAGHLIKRRLGDLSGGELQRVLLALALRPLPNLLLLDEPVSGMDQQGMELFYRMVSNLRYQCDLSIILVSHDLGILSHYADRVVFLNKTIQRLGTPQEVFADELVRNTFGPLRVCQTTFSLPNARGKGGEM